MLKPGAYTWRTNPRVPSFPDDRPVLVFDGHCVMCSGVARFVLRHDRSRTIRLLPAQTPLGRALYVHLGLDPLDYASNIFLDDGVAWLRGEGSLRLARRLGLPWSVAAGLGILPRRWQNWLYERLAANRFALFGRLEVCYRTEAGHADRFLG